MSEIGTFRDIENKVHEDLFNNLYLLRCSYQTSQEFDRVFKKGMFMKNNKTAFYEIVYYLLNILNPELTKEKLTTWPPFELKRENKFRSELLKYINELNHIYKHANIPPIMSSHLISPGGLKFTKFMLKLSQLVIFEHLKKKNAGLLLYCPIPNKNANVTKRMLNNLNRITLQIEIRTKEKLQKSQEYQTDQKNAATLLVNNLSDLDKSISAANKEYTAAKEEFHRKYTVYPSINGLKKKLTDLKQQWNSLSSIHTLFAECKSILNNLPSNDLVIKHTSTKPSEENELNLSEFFYKGASLITSKSLELPNPDSLHLQECSAELNLITEKYIQRQKDLDVTKKHIIAVTKEFDSFIYVPNLITVQPKINNSQVDLSEDTLGTKPLDDSPDN